VISSYRRSYFSSGPAAAVASARAGNVIGGGDWSENRLLPDIIRSIKNDTAVEIRNPFSTRPWQHVLEPLMGYLQLGLALLEDPSGFAEGWNFGPYTHQVYSVKQVIETIIRYAGKGVWKDLSQQQKPHEANLLLLDISKAIQKLGWQPRLPFEQAIAMTVDWYMHTNRQNTLEFTRQQINSYLKLWNSPKGN
jgi:CDP-glucose 4,6-dehydratase